jgi:hypothetical protein
MFMSIINVLNDDMLICCNKNGSYSIFDLEYNAEVSQIRENGRLPYIHNPVIFDENIFAVTNNIPFPYT